MPSADRLPHGKLAVLGVLTIVSFGVWFYGFGVLVEPIVAETGWRESLVTAAYGAALLLTGIGATVGGKVLDHRGSRTLFLALGLGAGPATVLASLAPNPWVFLVAAAAGGGLTGAGGYYHATQAVMARLAPAQRAKGITAITLYGAFASPIFLPVMGWLALNVGWRDTLRLGGVAITLAFLAAALLPNVTAHTKPTGGLRDAARVAGRDPAVRRLFIAGFGSGFGSSLLLLYQVPAMVDAGLTLGVASTLAGARGLTQLAGRIPLPPVVRWLGSETTLRLSYVLMAIGTVLLMFSGNLPTAIAFTVVAGVAIGALPAIEGIVAADVVDDATLGTTLGIYSLIRGVGAAAGPLLGGVVAEATGSRAVALLVAVAGAVLATFAVPRGATSDVPARRAVAAEPAATTREP